MFKDKVSKVQKGKKLWIIFDKFNVSDYTKVMVMNQKYKDENLLDNLVMVGVSNPNHSQSEVKANEEKKIIIEGQKQE